MNISKYCIVVVLFFGLFGCQTESEVTLSQREADRLFASAKSDIDHKHFADAASSLNLIQINYPQYADYDQLLYLLAKAQFNNKKYLEAQDNAHEYINSNPATQFTEEMSYVEAMSQFLLNESWSGSKTLNPRHLRDVTYLEKSKTNFEKFKKRYPYSKYLKTINQTLDQINDILADAELEVARYNFNHKAFLGAIHRAESIVKDYPKTKQAHEALVIMDNSFLKLGLNSEYQELKAKL